MICQMDPVVGSGGRPTGHSLDQKRLVILETVAWARKGRFLDNPSQQELLEGFSDFPYPRVVEHYHMTCLKWEGQKWLLNGREAQVMCIQSPALLKEQAVDPLSIPEELL
jgi:hypothetical protein